MNCLLTNKRLRVHFAVNGVEADLAEGVGVDVARREDCFLARGALAIDVVVIGENVSRIRNHQVLIHLGRLRSGAGGGFWAVIGIGSHARKRGKRGEQKASREADLLFHVPPRNELLKLGRKYKLQRGTKNQLLANKAPYVMALWWRLDGSSSRGLLAACRSFGLGVNRVDGQTA